MSRHLSRIKLRAEEPAGVKREAWPVTQGVPFTDGELERGRPEVNARYYENSQYDDCLWEPGWQVYSKIQGWQCYGKAFFSDSWLGWYFSVHTHYSFPCSVTTHYGER